MARAKKQKKTIQERYRIWREANPHMYDLFVRFSLQAWKAGRRTYGVKAIAERVRWHVNVDTNSTEEFKLSNNFTSRIARELQTHPEHSEKFLVMFKTRKLRSE